METKISLQRFRKLLVLLALVIFHSKIIHAQSASIYYLSVYLDPKLTQHYKVQSKDGDVLYGESLTFPSRLIDSLKNQSSLLIGDFLDMPTSVCELNSGNITFTQGLDYLGDLPYYTFKKALEKCEDNERYVCVYTRIYDGGGAIVINNGKSKYKPRLDVTVKVYDKEKNLIWKNKVGIKDFRHLRQQSKYYHGDIDIIRSETFAPEDIYAMYMIGLNLVLK